MLADANGFVRQRECFIEEDASCPQAGVTPYYSTQFCSRFIQQLLGVDVELLKVSVWPALGFLADDQLELDLVRLEDLENRSLIHLGHGILTTEFD